MLEDICCNTLIYIYARRYLLQHSDLPADVSMKAVFDCIGSIPAIRSYFSVVWNKSLNSAPAQDKVTLAPDTTVLQPLARNTAVLQPLQFEKDPSCSSFNCCSAGGCQLLREK